jgi:hypothetical protein
VNRSRGESVRVVAVREAAQNMRPSTNALLGKDFAKRRKHGVELMV